MAVKEYLWSFIPIANIQHFLIHINLMKELLEATIEMSCWAYYTYFNDH